MNELTLTPSYLVRRIYHLGRTLSAALEQAGIRYWTSGGTTLGLVRHRGLIPWDDDLDICLPDDEEQKLLALGPELTARLGLVLKEAATFGYRVFHQGEESEPLPGQELVDYRYPFCDVFLMAKSRSGKKYELAYR